MQFRSFGATGIRVSEIGYGTWGIGGAMWLGGTDAEAKLALHAAADIGVNFIDTALAYGDGHSESLIGRFLREREEPMTVATKIPPKNGRWPARPGTPITEAFPYDYVIKCTDRSLKNLGLETIDLQQFHVWLDDWADDDEWKRAVEDLKKSGKIQHAGFSINDHQSSNGLRTLATGVIDACQVIYNIFDQSPEKELFPAAREHEIAVIARVPFDEGALTGTVTAETKFPEGDWRNNYFRGDRKVEVARRAGDLRKLLGPEAITLPELALRFALHHPAVSVVIPGMRNVKNVRANCAVSDGKKLSPKILEELKKHAWEKNFY